MALSLVRASLRFVQRHSTYGFQDAICNWHAIRPIYWKESALGYTFSKKLLSNASCSQSLNFHFRCLCSSVKPEKLCWAGSSHDILLKKLDSCSRNHQVDEAWEAYTDFKRLYCFPGDQFLSRFITLLSYSSEPKWLQRACDIVLLLSKEKSNLLQLGLMYKLLLSLARAQMPLPASMILRLMIEKGSLPPTNLLGPVILHMVKKEIGTYLVSNLLIQICDHFQRLVSNRLKHAELIKPDSAIFNLVLDACISYKLSFKAQQIIELMSQVGVIGDAQTITIIARVHEINGQRDELKKLKYCVDKVVVPLAHHYCQYYDSLLSLHFKFNDIDAASKLILDMVSCRASLPSLPERKGLLKPFLIAIGSQNLREGLKLQVLPHLLPKDSLVKLERNEDLVTHKNGKFIIRNKAIAKLIIQHKRLGRITELSKLLSRIQVGQLLVESDCLTSDVIDACIHMGWLETAHDILEDLEHEGNLLDSRSYTSLLKAYYKDKKHREAQALLKQIRNAGLIIPYEMSVADLEGSSSCMSKPRMCNKSDLTVYLFHEMQEVETGGRSLIYELNSSIYFFMKAKMIDDALKTYRRMQGMNIHPTVATFMYMVMGYSSLEMYSEITILWGDIKRSSDNENQLVNRDLYELLLLNFLKGGYFERVMEVIGCMEKHGIYPDKWLYRSEFLKWHKDLYKKVKSSNARTEAQSKRIDHVMAFRKWTGID